MSHIKRKSQILLSSTANLNEQPSEVRKILLEMSHQKTSQRKNTFYQEGLISLKLAKYDSAVKQKHKFQLKNQLSPLKWKSSYGNEQFGKLQRISGRILTGWDMEKTKMAERSYIQPKNFHGVKCDYFSRQFPQDLSKTYSKGFNRKLKQVQVQYEKKVFEGHIQNIHQKRHKNIASIRSRGTRFQLSKDKLFGFTSPVKKSKQISNQRNTISHFYKTDRSKND